MGLYDRLGPIADEPNRAKFRMKFAPGYGDIAFKHVYRWDGETKCYTGFQGKVVIHENEIVDYFKTETPDGDPVHMFARQLDDILYTITPEMFEIACKEPGKGNTETFYLQPV